MRAAERPERQIRRAAHAFPPRWRRHSGEELVATALASLAPDAERAPRRLLVDIVLAGWRERRRDRPPLYRWVPYAVGVPIHPRWQVWARDDINGRFYPLRVWLRSMTPIVPLALVGILTLSAPLNAWLGGLSGAVAGSAVSAVWHADRYRQRARRRNGIREDDPPWPPVPTVERLDRTQ